MSSFSKKLGLSVTSAATIWLAISLFGCCQTCPKQTSNIPPKMSMVVTNTNPSKPSPESHDVASLKGYGLILNSDNQVEVVPADGRKKYSTSAQIVQDKDKIMMMLKINGHVFSGTLMFDLNRKKYLGDLRFKDDPSQKIFLESSKV